MTRIGRIAAGAATGLILAVTGCSIGGADSFDVPLAPSSAAASATAAPVQTPEQDQMYGPRVELPGGLLLKQLGKVAQYGVSDDPDQWEVRVVVDKIEVDPKCSQYAPKPERGHRVVASIRVETSERFDVAHGLAPNGGAWSTVGADGVSEAPGFTVCDTNTMIPNQLRPAAKYRGQVAIDTANAKGQLILLNNYVWNYGT